jgi:hypothetical protein
MSYGVALRNGVPFTLGTIAALCTNATGSAWSPADMPSLGAWYDPSDLSTMFQDAAGTTPVTAAGQPVGLILDKSGNGYHASQSTSTARPLFQVDGSGHCYLAFDGVDDYLNTAAIDLTGTDKVTVFAGAYKGAAPEQILVEFSTNTGLNVGAWYITQPYNSASVGSAGLGPQHLAVNLVSVGEASVVTLQADISAPLNSLRINGVDGTDSTSNQGTGTYGNWPLFIGARSGPNYPFNGKIYSIIIGGAAYDAATVLAAEQWVADKTGVTL